MSGPEPTREHPYEPEPGDVVEDAGRGRVGRVMGHEGPYVQLRPLRGGLEWDAEPGGLEPVSQPQSDALSAAVAETNQRSRGEIA
ncbi:hypothetical protein ACFYMW_03065 [Streptomyces sp. NPDC006692]|uniref:hypothetical protein n=1 Tax=Streptomyces sp. NPDC006692 TaxID=3364758 RepID=UPI00369C4FBA